MFHARAGLWGRLRRTQTKLFCSGTTKINNGDKIESNVSSYNEAYKQLDKLDFISAAKILFTDPPKKKKFGSPSLQMLNDVLTRLYFVSGLIFIWYNSSLPACHHWELEFKEAEEKAKSNPVILEVKTRLGKLEETVNEIVAESKKQSSGSMTKNQGDTQNKSESESSSSVEKDHVGKPKSVNQNISKPDQMDKTQNAESSEDAMK
ncbi:hypothetical protein JRO89_XS04G0111900 [Xanthoceras sorbifolium]|uniref:Uncharacterized protein n=1 Tax=Xanthoceras sorbifolium TaxID=99658 RepID=A0ABQ8I4U9_9ROSI|nr:hypothetical protein JRO89_XS04G0111900 [Xanthoceras sorbifolium]